MTSLKNRYDRMKSLLENIARESEFTAYILARGGCCCHPEYREHGAAIDARFRDEADFLMKEIDIEEDEINEIKSDDGIKTAADLQLAVQDISPELPVVIRCTWEGDTPNGNCFNLNSATYDNAHDEEATPFLALDCDQGEA